MMRVLGHGATLTALALVALNLGLSGVSTAAPELAPDRIVFPTGQFPTDVNNVQAAVDLGGTVLLKATTIAGAPDAFNFGPPVSGPGTVFLRTDVRVIGETVAGDRTTIIGGSFPFRNYAPVRSAIHGIFFDGPRALAVHVLATRGFEFSGNHVARVVPFPLVSLGGTTSAQGIWVDGFNLTGTIRIENNVFEDVGWAELGYGVKVSPDRAEVTIARNTIRGASLAGIISWPASGHTVIEDNYVASGPFNGAFPDNFGNGIHILGTNTGGTVTVRHNEVFCENPGADGIILIGWSLGYGPLYNQVIEKNDITMVNSNYGGISLIDEVSNVMVKDNRIFGDGVYGLNIVTSPDTVAISNTFLGNNLTGFKAAGADLFLDANTQNTVANGHFDTVVDLGSGNQITGP